MGKVKTQALIILFSWMSAAQAAPSLAKGLTIETRQIDKQSLEMSFSFKPGYKFTQRPKFESKPKTTLQVSLKQKGKLQYHYQIKAPKVVEHINVRYQVCYGKEYCFPPVNRTL